MPHTLPESLGIPSQGCVVHCRSHRWLVEEVEPDGANYLWPQGAAAQEV